MNNHSTDIHRVRAFIRALPKDVLIQQKAYGEEYTDDIYRIMTKALKKLHKEIKKGN